MSELEGLTGLGDMFKTLPIAKPNIFGCSNLMNETLAGISQFVAEKNGREVDSQRATIRIAEQNDEQIELLKTQVIALYAQNALLGSNNEKLVVLNESQAKTYDETKEELKNSKRSNKIMMIIAIIACVASVAGPIVTWFVAK